MIQIQNKKYIKNKRAIPRYMSSTLLVYLFIGNREIASVSCRQFGTVRLIFKLSTYIQGTVGDR
jgi:hypothetical protein